jgi:hypothetical protein
MYVVTCIWWFVHNACLNIRYETLKTESYQFHYCKLCPPRAVRHRGSLNSCTACDTWWSRHSVGRTAESATSDNASPKMAPLNIEPRKIFISGPWLHTVHTHGPVECNHTTNDMARIRKETNTINFKASVQYRSGKRVAGQTFEPPVSESHDIAAILTKQIPCAKLYTYIWEQHQCSDSLYVLYFITRPAVCCKLLWPATPDRHCWRSACRNMDCTSSTRVPPSSCLWTGAYRTAR